MPQFNRRQFLTLSASATGGLLLSQCSQGSTNRSSGLSSPPSVPVVQSQGGLLRSQLQASQGNVDIGGQSINLMSYGAQIPGPRLEAQPGDTVQIQLSNNLTESTNLHFHGLHVSPADNADNIFLEIPRGERFTYEFEIPANHPGGTFYYHPHYHGLVGRQVFAGLGGIFVVRGPLDQVPEVQAAREEFLFLKDIDPEGGLSQARPMDRMLGREGDLVTVSGQKTPNYSVDPGGLLRLRLVNASAARFYRLSLEEHPFYLIATDGGALAAPVELRELLLAPGERAEVLVRGDREPGRYRLLNLPYNRGGMGMMGGGGGMGGGGMGRGGSGMGGGMGQQQQTEPQTLASVSYSDQPTSTPLPEQLVPITALPEAQRTRQFRLHHGMAPGQGMVFLINDRAYHHDRVDTTVSLNTVEDWELTNPDPMDHPFHVHTNPFQVIQRDGRPEPYLAWKDTVLVPAGETVQIRTRFDKFAGKSLYHCHILDHEDLGMAGILEITA